MHEVVPQLKKDYALVTLGPYMKVAAKMVEFQITG
jgi:hypothetical protein